MTDQTPERNTNLTGVAPAGNLRTTGLFTVTDDRGTVTWVANAPQLSRPKAAALSDTAAVAGGWLFGPTELVAAVRDALATAADGEHEVRYGSWTTMPADRDCPAAVLIAMLLALPSGTVGPQLWDQLPTETVPEGAIR